MQWTNIHLEKYNWTEPWISEQSHSQFYWCQESLPSIWKILDNYGIPVKLINIIKALYSRPTCSVKTSSGTAEPFEIMSGVRQGCILSPFLFIVSLDFVMRRAMNNQNSGITWQDNDRLTDLDFADDIALLAENNQQCQQMTQQLKAESAKIGLRINLTKTKILKLGPQPV